ncbi:protein IMPACT isoform X2 [Rhinoraja longicauda]
MKKTGVLSMRQRGYFASGSLTQNQNGPSVSSAPWLRGHERAALSNDLEEIYLQNSGDCVLFLWVQKIQEFLQLKARSNSAAQHGHKGTEEAKVDHRASSTSVHSPSRHISPSDAYCQSSDDEDLPPMVHGDPLTDRRSTFQAHLAPVVTLKQVKMHLQKLYQNKKIAGATHNIYAYRIYCEDKRTFIQDCEDDGETAAGGRMLHLMQILDVRNVMVVVSRWYGGILLGPDRFKHINNCARNLLVEEGYSEPAGEVSKTPVKSKKPKNKK